MKKTLILISIFMMTLASCSGKNKTADKAPAKQTVGLPNPIHESSAEEITEQLEVNFAVPDGAKDVHYSIIAGNLAQMVFIWNDAECTARIEHNAESEDIRLLLQLVKRNAMYCRRELRNCKMANNRNWRSSGNLYLAE